MNISY